ncbi:MAG: hypothetical protein ACRCU6_11235 [Fusobacteriaceae bacterium]
MIYFFRPEISELNNSIWKDFYNGAINTLKNFRPQNILEISSLDRFSFNEGASENDLLIFFNPITEIYDLENILEIAIEKNITIFPIAIDESNRRPSALRNNDWFQSFDIITEKKLRGLDDKYIHIIGECFGRDIIISHHPALFDDKIKIFLSHKRHDFEEKSQIFKVSLHAEKENVFIDLHELRVGDDAQERIEAKLKEDTDILIFIQTENTYNSKYQLIELKKAFELSIPVLWITVGLNKNEIRKLPLHPAGTPHYELEEITPELVNKISNYAFDLIKLKKLRLLDSVIYKFNLLKKKKISYTEICNRNNIYQIIKESKSDFFPNDTECSYEFFKCLCRKYKDEDLENLKKYLNKPSIRNYILALKSEPKELESNIHLKNYDDFFKENNSKILSGGVIISGSFPDSIDLKYQQNIIDALYTIVKGILERGGKIIFGSHPTFQGVILEIGKNFNSEYEKKIKLYVSEFFKGKYDPEYFQENSELFKISADKDIELSLSKMRVAMINDSEAKAIICIGGKDKDTSLTAKKPGLDEEIELAKKRGLKVFVLGSTGGRCKELISEGLENPIENEKDKREVTFGNNFNSILNIILNEIGE